MVHEVMTLDLRSPTPDRRTGPGRVMRVVPKPQERRQQLPGLVSWNEERQAQAFAQEGITPQYLTIQNEPLNETKNYPGTLLKADQAKRFIGVDLGPAMRAAGLQTQVLAYENMPTSGVGNVYVAPDAAATPLPPEIKCEWR